LHEQADEHGHAAVGAAGARELVHRVFPRQDVVVEAHGNCLTGLAFWVGMAAEELTPTVLTSDDPAFPLLVTIRATKP